MHQRRPDWLSKRIDDAAKYPIGSVFPYEYDGTDADYAMAGPTGDQLYVSSLLTSNRQLSILDIGAAHGGFVQRAQTMGHIAHALTLDDYRGKSHIADNLQEGTYIVGDAERLSETDGLLESYDLVVSSKTFWWLTDPLGTLEQAVDKVAPNGKLIIDSLTWGRGGLYPNDRLNGKINYAHVSFELARAGFTHIMINENDQSNGFDGYADIHAQRRAGDFAKAAFSIDYESSELVQGMWSYTPLS